MAAQSAVLVRECRRQALYCLQVLSVVYMPTRQLFHELYPKFKLKLPIIWVVVISICFSRHAKFRFRYLGRGPFGTRTIGNSKNNYKKVIVVD